MMRMRMMRRLAAMARDAMAHGPLKPLQLNKHQHQHQHQHQGGGMVPADEEGGEEGSGDEQGRLRLGVAAGRGGGLGPSPRFRGHIGLQSINPQLEEQLQVVARHYSLPINPIRQGIDNESSTIKKMRLTVTGYLGYLTRYEALPAPHARLEQLLSGAQLSAWLQHLLTFRGAATSTLVMYLSSVGQVLRALRAMDLPSTGSAAADLRMASLTWRCMQLELELQVL